MTNKTQTYGAMFGHKPPVALPSGSTEADVAALLDAQGWPEGELLDRVYACVAAYGVWLRDSDAFCDGTLEQSAEAGFDLERIRAYAESQGEPFDEIVEAAASSLTGDIDSAHALSQAAIDAAVVSELEFENDCVAMAPARPLYNPDDSEAIRLAMRVREVVEGD